MTTFIANRPNDHTLVFQWDCGKCEGHNVLILGPHASTEGCSVRCEYCQKQHKVEFREEKILIVDIYPW